MTKTKKPKISFATMEDLDNKFFANDPKAIELFFNEALEDYIKTGDKAEFQSCMKLIAKWKGISKIAEETNLTRQGVHKAVGGRSNPSFTTVLGILRSAGYKLKISYSGK